MFLQLNLKYRLFLFITCSFVCGFFINNCHAQAITQDQALNFGTFAFSTFNSPSQITIEDDGSFTVNTNATVLVNPARGEYTVTGGGAFANMAYNVTLPASIVLTGPGGTFEIDNFRVSPPVLITDSTGTGDFSIAATITSQGGGVSYGNGSYTQSLDITVTF